MGAAYKRKHWNSEAFQNPILSSGVGCLHNSEGKYCPRSNKSELIKSMFTNRSRIGFKPFTPNLNNYFISSRQLLCIILYSNIIILVTLTLNVSNGISLLW